MVGCRVSILSRHIFVNNDIHTTEEKVLAKSPIRVLLHRRVGEVSDRKPYGDDMLTRVVTDASLSTTRTIY